MPRFRYEAREPGGTPIEGEIEAQNRGHALVLLRERGLAVDLLAEARTQARGASAAWGQGPLYPLWPVRWSSIALFFDQLGRLLSAGVTPHDAFSALQDRVGGRLRRVAREGAQTFARGGSISGHLDRYPRFFPPYIVAIFRAGERSGDYTGACKEIVVQCETESRVRRHITLLKVYTASIALLCILVPSFPRIISRTVAANPNQTTVSLTAEDLWQYLRPGLAWYGHHVVYDIVPWLIGFWVLTKVAAVVLGLPSMTGFRDRLGLYTPILSSATKKAAVARFTRTLELMQQAAVPLGDSVREAARATGNLLVAQRVAAPSALVDSGGRLSDVFRASGIFSPSQVSLLTTAEESGTLVDALGQLAERARQERDNFLKGAGWGGCATAFIVASVLTLFAAAAGWKAIYDEIYKVFESEAWGP